MTDVLKALQAYTKKVKTVEVETNELGKVTLKALYTSHRLKFHTMKGVDPLLLMIAMSLCDPKGNRYIDSLDIEEVIAMIDPLGSTESGLEDIHNLYQEASKVSALSNDDVEDAAKN